MQRLKTSDSQNRFSGAVKAWRLYQLSRDYSNLTDCAIPYIYRNLTAFTFNKRRISGEKKHTIPVTIAFLFAIISSEEGTARWSLDRIGVFLFGKLMPTVAGLYFLVEMVCLKGRGGHTGPLKALFDGH